MEIGIDIIENARFDGLLISNQKLMKKIFTNNEIEFCKKKANPSQHFAARFAAKEAVRKVLIPRGILIPYNKIEISTDKKGAPYLNIEIKKEINFYIKISMSHSFSSSCSVALLYYKGDYIDGK